MHGMEEVLSLDLMENDFLYRIRRDSRIVYVSVLHADIVPAGERTDSFRILSHLRVVPKWDDHWTTLTVRKGSDGVIQSIADEFQPHSLNTKLLDGQNPNYYDIMSLELLDRISARVSRVSLGSKTSIMKIAMFQYEIRYLQREVSVYTLLASRGFRLAPKVLGHVYEEQKDRTIGFLMEDISGTEPGMDDLEACQKTIRLLHGYGVLHGDAHRYNFLMTSSGAIVFDFEAATVKDAEEVKESMESDNEIGSMEEKFKDDSGIGKY
ncbi:hypothetical protein N7456_009075 [Penicillium angulare]|uniref:Aminoglycoside phosphotransferase domain-containing protein n=1 Tax=Penicillium angulare TaxID=116970 RepID=A0A9W9F473_9EURO|nr:hypothetical protein N7456_009075 [Penicillium angulare]